MNCYHLYTNPGLEDLAEEEVLRLLPPPPGSTEAAPAGLSGVAAVHTSLAPDRFGKLPFRLIYHAVLVLKTGRVEGLEELPEEEALREILRLADKTDFALLQTRCSIAVRCRRRGDHSFRSPALERALGTLLVERYRCPVNLTAPEVTLRVDISGTRVDLGYLVTPPEMDRRFTWVYRPRVTLSPVTAQALLRISLREDVRPREGALLDPFCGSGTIPIEAASSDPRTHLFASDISPEAVAGTRGNLGANHLEDRVVTRCGDATDPRWFRSAWSNRGIDRVVCNPPYGVRLGRKIDYRRFYRDLLRGAAAVLPPGGRLVMMSSRRRGALNNVLASTGEWRIVHVRIIETGGVYPGIFLLERR